MDATENNASPITARGPWRQILAGLGGPFTALFLFSGIINLLALTGAFYMLQVYDRVLTSHSIPTLLALSVLAIGLFVFYGAFDILRAQMLARLGRAIDDQLTPIAHRASMLLPIHHASPSEAMQPLRDAQTISRFFGSNAPIAILDLPWIPLFLGFIFLLHPLLGMIATLGTALLVGFTWATEHLTRSSQRATSGASNIRSQILESHVRNAETLNALGMVDNAAKRYDRANALHLNAHLRSSDVTGGFSSASKVFRLMLQSAMLGFGAYLALHGQLTAGAIIAASIAASRALAPVELAIGHWKSFVAARQSAGSLFKSINSLPVQTEPLELPAPHKSLVLEDVCITAPITERPILSGVSFKLRAGQGLGIIGPSAVGKSTLAKAITNVWPLADGHVRLDGASLQHWTRERLGRHVGYLPQHVELLEGTIAQNIARLDASPNPEVVIAAARAAGVHEMILSQPDGYETQIGSRGSALSSGQRQRIGLARALYENPFLVVLDEPNSNLDAEGEAALTTAIRSVRERKGIVVIITHRASALSAVDQVALLQNGKLSAFGPKEQLLRSAPKPKLASVA